MAQTNPTDYTYVASGSPDFLVPFPYLSTSEVEVTVDGASTGVIWTASQSIQLTPTPAVGALVRVRRTTDARAVRNDFSAGAPFSPRNINENNEQLLYVVQEAVNASQAASDVATGVAATAAGAVATANAADAKAQLAIDTARASGVNSFKARTGAVVPEAGDYTAAQIAHNTSNVGDTLDGLQSALTLLAGTTVGQTGATGAATIPAGTEAQRPASPVNGQLRYNSEKSQFEGYQGGGWKPIGGGDSSPMFSVMWWPQRSAIPAGYVAADGQTLSRATYPDAWAGIQAGNVPTVADATWNSTPTERGKFTAGDGSTTFRLPDYNGKFAGSLGAVFLRGDGTLSAAIAGVIQRDELKSHTHTVSTSTSATGIGVRNGGSGAHEFLIPDAAYATGGNETRPLNVTGCWVIKLFGAAVNVGSADAAQSASDFANLAAQSASDFANLVNQIDFTIIYPNGGSAASPASVAVNSRYVMANPFPGHAVICEAELYRDGAWGRPGFVFSDAGYGTVAGQLADSIILRTGSGGLNAGSGGDGGHLWLASQLITAAPCRVKVWKVKGAIV